MSTGTIRRFEWADVSGLVSVFNEIGGLSGTAREHDADTLSRMLSLPGCDPQRHCLVAVQDDEIVGYSLTAYEPPIGRAVASGGITQAYRRRGIGRALLSHTVAHAAALDVDVLHIEVRADDCVANDMLASEGFAAIKTHWQMRWQCSDAPEVRLPEGFVVRPLATGQDEPALTELQNIAFGENWGFSPNTVEQITARVANNRGGPESILFIVEDGEPAAYNWTMLDDAPSPESERAGVISMTGVHPRYRGRGIGRAVVAAGIAHLVVRGASAIYLEVDADNTPARELYLKLGFRKVGRTVWHELRFN